MPNQPVVANVWVLPSVLYMTIDHSEPQPVCLKTPNELGSSDRWNSGTAMYPAMPSSMLLVNVVTRQLSTVLVYNYSVTTRVRDNSNHGWHGWARKQGIKPHCALRRNLNYPNEQRKCGWIIENYSMLSKICLETNNCWDNETMRQRLKKILYTLYTI